MNILHFCLLTGGCLLITLLMPRSVSAASAAAGQAERGATFNNPILPGFHPDPSICRVGDDFYLVNSSFEYFPAVPIFHSRDLVNWQLIAHVFTRPTQLDLTGEPSSGAIYAPTLRYHNGTFYVIVSRLQHHTGKILNILSTATNPTGPWSDPVVVTDHYFNIDPSLFFDDDGKLYLMANRGVGQGTSVISIQELDPTTFKLLGVPHDIGAAFGYKALWAEGPHLYKKDGFYYLLIAEGGTEYNHAVTISRSHQVFGPYEQNPANPILTHRHLGPDADIQCTGHADVVETAAGEWWMVCLGTREHERQGTVLGRETFLVPMRWNKGEWPLVNPGIGRVQLVERRPNLPPFDPPPPLVRDDFASPTLDLHWNFVRTPLTPFWSLDARKNWLRIALKPELLSDETNNPAFICRRLEKFDYTAITQLDFTPASETESAGLAIRSGLNSLRLVKNLSPAGPLLRVYRHEHSADSLIAEVPAPPGPLYLKVISRNEFDYTFYFSTTPGGWTPIGPVVDARLLRTDSNQGGRFTGSFIGMYATSAGQPTANHADFKFFELD